MYGSWAGDHHWWVGPQVAREVVTIQVKDLADLQDPADQSPTGAIWVGDLGWMPLRVSLLLHHQRVATWTMDHDWVT